MYDNYLEYVFERKLQGMECTLSYEDYKKDLKQRMEKNLKKLGKY